MRRGTAPLWGDDDLLEAYRALSGREKNQVRAYVRRLSGTKPRFRWSSLSETWPNVWGAVAQMDGYEFEDFVRILCIRKGYELAPRLRRTKDEGVNLFASEPDSGKYVIVQCKLSRHNVGPDVVSRLFADCIAHGVSRGMVFTNQEFTRGGEHVRRALRAQYDGKMKIQVELMDWRRIDEWLRSPEFRPLKEIFRDARRLGKYLRNSGRSEVYVQRRLGPLRTR